MKRPCTIRELKEQTAAGVKHEFVFFFGEKNANGYMSQFATAPFVKDGITYRTAEHWMMASKARTFGDDAALEKILKVSHPFDAKKLGRAVRNFSIPIWNEKAYGLVLEGNLMKFRQNPELLKLLLATGDKILVEASPSDKIWGIGLAAYMAKNPLNWPGMNLLGFVLMEVRDILRAEAL
jgi:ribA/ribD-fused uncharacterized protein